MTLSEQFHYIGNPVPGHIKEQPELGKDLNVCLGIRTNRFITDVALFSQSELGRNLWKQDLL